MKDCMLHYKLFKAGIILLWEHTLSRTMGPLERAVLIQIILIPYYTHMHTADCSLFVKCIHTNFSACAYKNIISELSCHSNNFLFPIISLTQTQKALMILIGEKFCMNFLGKNIKLYPKSIYHLLIDQVWHQLCCKYYYVLYNPLLPEFITTVS